MKIKLLNILYVISLFMICISCEKEDTEMPEEENGILVSLAYPKESGGSAFTRAMNEGLGTLRVLYFIKSGSDYIYRGLNSFDTTPTADANGNYTYRLTPPFVDAANNTTEAMKLVFIANAESEVAAVAGVAGKIVTGTTTLANAYQYLTAVTSTTAKISLWTKNKKGDEVIPMAVETEEVSLPTGKTAPTGNHYVGGSSSGATNDKVYSLVRMAAKVKIVNTVITTNTSTKKNFKITNAWIINGNDEGFLCYQGAISGSATHTYTIDNKSGEKSGHVVTAVSAIPSGAEKSVKDNNNKLTPTLSADGKTQTLECYILEATSSSTGNITDITSNCHIRLEGKRWEPGDAESTATNVNYMIPFPKLTHTSGASGITIDISTTDGGHVLRNHFYDYTVNGVNDFGTFAALSVKNWTTVDLSNYNPTPIR
ncbi:hypothetical protein [Bacteroides sp. 224]|uniref:hypothetical protein n=1 Tax=Bacteroides sp. 224 TaxID=2302936 RepID=UPI0013D50A0E|nr:hypothetical protein [Bacteroides sp. 224]NDV66499.1 hypothetical protein [Bacteroides sp. 224]